MTPITAQLCKGIRPEIEATLKEVFSRHNLSGKMKSIHWDETGFYFSVEVSPVMEDGTIKNREAVDFTIYAHQLGMDADWLGQTFLDNQQQQVTIMGLKPRSHTFPVVVKVGGKLFKYSAWAVISGMKKNTTKEVAT